MDIMNLAAKISLDSKGFESNLKDSESKFKGFGDKISAWTVAKGQLIADFSKKAASSIGNFVKDSISETNNFDKSMSQVAATLGKSTDEIKELSDFARQMGAETAFSANEAAQALNYMALAGYDSEKSMRMLPQVLNLAAAGNFDLATASDMVTDAQSALGLSIEETETMVNRMAKTSSTTNTSVQQLGDAMLTVGGTAKMLKGGTTELSAVLGVLADNGIKGSEGGTALRNVLLSLSAPTDKAKEQIEALGLQVFDAEGNMRSMPDILADINEKTKDMTQEQRTNVFNTIFNKRDLKAVEALLGTATDRWDDLYKAIGNAGDAASEMAKTQLDNLSGDVTIFNSALSEARIILASKLTPSLRKFVQFGTSSIQDIGNAIKEGGISGGLEMLGKILSERLPKFFRDISPKIKGAFKNLFKGVKTGLANLLGVEAGDQSTWGQIASKAYEKLKNSVKNLTGKAKVKVANWLGLTDEDGNPVDDTNDTTWGKIAGAAYKKLTEKLTKFTGWTKIHLANWLGLTDENGNAVDDEKDVSWANIARSAYEKIKEKIKETVGNTKGSLAKLLGFVDEDGQVIEDTTWGEIGKSIIGKISEAMGKGGSFLQKLILGDDYIEGDKGNWKKVGEKLSGWLKEAFAEGGLADTFLQTLAAKGTALAEFAGTLVTEIATWIAEHADSIVGIVIAIADSIAKNADKFVDAIVTIITSPKLWEAFGKLGEALINAIFGKGSISKIKSFFGIAGENGHLFSGYAKNMGQSYVDSVVDENSQTTWLNSLTEGLKEAGVEAENIKKIIDFIDKQDPTDADSKNFIKNFIENLSSENVKEYLDNIFSAEDINEYIKLNPPVEPVLSEEELAEQNNKAQEFLNANPLLQRVIISGFDPSSALPQGNLYGSDSDGNNAKGNWNVPYDNFLANLHRGEMVLTTSQARKYRDGEQGNVNISALLKGVIGAIREGMDGAQVNSYMDSGSVNRHVNSVTGQTLMSRRFA